MPVPRSKTAVLNAQRLANRRAIGVWLADSGGYTPPDRPAKFEPHGFRPPWPNTVQQLRWYKNGHRAASVVDGSGVYAVVRQMDVGGD